MRAIPIAASIFLALFGYGAAHDQKTPAASVIVAPKTGYFTSQLIGAEVYNSQNKDLARVADISVGTDGQIQAFVLKVSEYEGLVAHFVAIKPSALTFESSIDDGLIRAHMSATEDQLRAAPEYRYTGTGMSCLKF